MHNGPKKKKSRLSEDPADYINSSRGGHGAPAEDQSKRSMMSDSASSSREGPPRVYEEMIQILEGDVRKHIRIEQ